MSESRTESNERKESDRTVGSSSGLEVNELDDPLDEKGCAHLGDISDDFEEKKEVGRERRRVASVKLVSSRPTPLARF